MATTAVTLGALSVLLAQASTPTPTRIERLESRIEELETDVKTLEMRFRFFRDADKTVTIDPAASASFQRLKAAGGDYFFVSLESVEPHLDGVRVRIKIGNPSFANYNGFDINAKWGQRIPEQGTKGAAEAWARWRESVRSKDYQFTTILKAGAWNSVVITLSPAAPSEFGFLEVSMSTGTIYMNRDP